MLHGDGFVTALAIIECRCRWTILIFVVVVVEGVCVTSIIRTGMLMVIAIHIAVVVVRTIQFIHLDLYFWSIA